MAQQAIRDYLKSKGLADDQITYDNGTVMAKGKRFMDATPDATGVTHADTNTLERAYGNYDTMNQLADLRTRATTPNPDITGYQQAIKDRLSKPVQPFQYNAQSDPQYQAALRTAQQNAQTGGNNAMVALGSRGIGNSSITGDRVAQIQQRELGRVTDTVLPQLTQQAYQQYLGQNQLENQQLGNMVNYANNLSSQDQNQIANLAQVLGLQNNYNQQQTTNDRNTAMDERQKQQDHISLANYLTSTYGKAVNPTEDPGQSYAQVEGLTPLAMQQYLQGVKAQDAGLTGMYNDKPTMQRETMSFNQGLQDKQFGLSERQANASIANMGAGNTRADEAAAIAREKFDLEKSQPNASEQKAKAARQQKMMSEKQGLVNALRSGETSVDQARKTIQEDLQFGFYTPDEARELLAILEMYGKPPGMPSRQQLTSNTLNPMRGLTGR